MACIVGGWSVLAQAHTERFMNIIIPSRNNAAYCVRNLDSVRTQRYTHWRIIYFDDNSTDGTGKVVKNYLDQHQLHDRVTLIANPERYGALANYYTAIHMVAPHELLVFLDGDDFLAHDRVLERVNAAYNDENTWMTYGQYQEWPTGRAGHCRAVPEGVHVKNVYREYDWIFSHLRTFYAWLPQQIKLQDLLYNGKFLPVASDVALIFPLVEMAGRHCTFIPDVLYLHNVETPHNDFKKRLIEQHHFNYYLRSRPKYQPLEKPVMYKKDERKEATLVVLSSCNAGGLKRLLSSVCMHAVGLKNIAVVYNADQEHLGAYQKVKQSMPVARFYQASSATAVDELKKVVAEITTPYVWCAYDTACVTEAVDLQAALGMLEQTKAYGFYAARSEQEAGSLPLQEVGKELFAWQFKQGAQEWRRANTLNMVLYTKEHLLKMLSLCQDVALHQIEQTLALSYVESDAVGLTAKHAWTA